MQEFITTHLFLILLGILFFLGLAVLGVNLINNLKSAPLIKKIYSFFALILLLFFCGILIFTAKTISAYQTFTYKELIAIIRCVKSEDKSYNFSLYYTPVKYNKSGATSVYLIRGDQWSFGGDILKWHPGLNILGLKPCHRPTRICGRFVRAKDANAALPTEYDINNGTDWLWIFLHKYNQYFPFVEAVYGNSVYTFADLKYYYEIYVTASGYMIKKELLK